MISHILNSGGNNSLMKHDVVQGNNIVDLDLLRNLNGVTGLNSNNFIYLFFIVTHFFFTKNIHYLNALSEILFLSPVVSGHSGYFSRLFYF
ncbi:hypothetical protein J4Y59_20470, partial [Escherichia coli]